MINSFEGEYRFLSNFYPCSIIMDGVEYPSVEHAYQAAKTVNSLERSIFQTGLKSITAAQAKKAGRNITIRNDWESIKLKIMKDLLLEKFNDPELKQKLIDTFQEELIEGNWWRDTFWGVCRGQGENWLGKLLMEVRDYCRLS